jgi:hypothetical protein
VLEELNHVVGHVTQVRNEQNIEENSLNQSTLNQSRAARITKFENLRSWSGRGSFVNLGCVLGRTSQQLENIPPSPNFNPIGNLNESILASSSATVRKDLYNIVIAGRVEKQSNYIFDFIQRNNSIR